jgi:nitrate reductase gamma subunit
MHGIYQFVSGPLARLAFTVFVVGSLYRLVQMFVLVYRKEKFIFSFMSWKYSLRSIFHWIIPFAAVNMQKHPILTLVTFTFHICLLVTPVFLLSHSVLWDEYWNLRWWSLPDALSDIMTLAVVACCVFFWVRRLKQPEVRYLTTSSDFVILAMVAAPFVTGFAAYHQWIDYPFFMVFHVLSGDILLMAIPFTRLSHMLFSPFTRAYMGSEFGNVRHARDW